MLGKLPKRTTSVKYSRSYLEDVELSRRLLQDLVDTISMQTTNLSFHYIKEAKLLIDLGNLIPKKSLKNLHSFGNIIQELKILWKINRMDLDLLEKLLDKVKMLKTFKDTIDRFKEKIQYENLTMSSEHDVTSIISSLHNILQNSQSTHKVYTTICLLHFGDGNSFNRKRLVSLKEEVTFMLGINYYQMTYISKMQGPGNGFVTVYQFPMTAGCKLVSLAREGNENLIGLGLQGLQIIGSNGLKYTQHLPRNVHQNSLLQPSKQSVKGDTLDPKHDQFYLSRMISSVKIKSQKFPLLESQQKQTKARMKAIEDTINLFTRPENLELIDILLQQIKKLNTQVSSLKKDLQTKTRRLNYKQGLVRQIEKEIKKMEMKLEIKAVEISSNNDRLVQKLYLVNEENKYLRNSLRKLQIKLEKQNDADKEKQLQELMTVSQIKKISYSL